ncbi:hypothetical protein [Litorimonas sp. WD9-15]|uniref:hypothetical protein n=1 Tax=Litorimonas sp. WD9-15 TaxID=3418716 RepID=UPI003D00214C
MTLKTRKTALTAALSIMAAGSIAFIPASAMAADQTETTSQFEVATTTDGVVKSGVKAYRKGDYEKAIALHRAAIKGSMSKRKTAVAQSNLCASWAMMGDLEQAEEACDTALDLRPDYKPALANKELLNIKLAQK